MKEEITRDDVIKKVQDRLNGKIETKELMEWAWSQLWNYETGKIKFEEKYSNQIFDVITTLTSRDTEPNVQLSGDYLKSLIGELKK